MRYIIASLSTSCFENGGKACHVGVFEGKTSWRAQIGAQDPVTHPLMPPGHVILTYTCTWRVGFQWPVMGIDRIDGLTD